MHFGKELEEDLVPEWRAKYFNYKQAKKRIKAVQRALRNAHRTTPQVGYPQGMAAFPPRSDPLPFTHYDFHQRQSPEQERDESPKGHRTEQSGTDGAVSRPAAARRESMTMFSTSPPVTIRDRQNTPDDTPETQPLQIPFSRPRDYRQRDMSYGSIVGSPPEEPAKPLPALELPAPALSHAQATRPAETQSSGSDSPLVPRPATTAPSASDAYHVGKDQKPRKFSNLPRRLFGSLPTTSSPQGKKKLPPSGLRRMFSTTALESPGKDDVQLDAYRELDTKQFEFYEFLDGELGKIEKFYKMKEEEASDRLRTLRQQLHELRDQRATEIRAMKQGKKVKDGGGVLEGLLPAPALPIAPSKSDSQSAVNGNGNGKANGHSHSFLQPVEDAVRRKSTHIGKTSKAMQHLGSPTTPHPMPDESRQDYVRRNNPNETVPYRFAKRRLKLALQEFYRGLELLKSYALLNRTAFRKINKKYDKAVNARPTGRYMNEKVNGAHFVTSNVIEGHLVAVEDLYARYFERGNHKIAVGKLRTKLKPEDQSASAFRNGFFIAAAVAFGCIGLSNAAILLDDTDPTISIQTSYLLQLYAGYFLGVILFLMFCLDCMIWRNSKINYVFIFEYDTRHVLDWRQLSELPCFFLFLNGIFMWLNFRGSGNDSMYTFWPLIMIVLTLLIMVAPFPVLYPHARKWWGFSNFRLLLAGLYPVEFRDFYLGDMYCSETYSMSQIELFFCLYVNNWDDPGQCNSTHSRLLGFFTTLPGIWRALQCIRRYYDSGNWFPHLANCAKYGGNILYYMTLSIYRIHKVPHTRAVFIVFAAINAVYCSFWDVAYDFSLGNYYARYPFLRDRLGYRQPWVYYVAIVSDVLLRQTWIFYAIFTEDVQHSALLSFFVGLAEVLRRGMWSLFRVENEHCNNVGKFRASRDIPLPYSLPGSTSPELHQHDDQGKPSPIPEHPDQPPPSTTPSAQGTGADLERLATVDTTGSLRQRRKPPTTPQTPGIRALQRVGTLFMTAHSQDYQKAKRPGDAGGDGIMHSPHDRGREGDARRDESSDEDDEEGEADIDDEEGDDLARQATAESVEGQRDSEEIMQVQRLVSRGRRGS